jgi:pyridoxamine 5'-phosphate oxidase family protein
MKIAYLRTQPIAGFTTLGDDGRPDVGPAAVEFDGTYLWVSGGHAPRPVERTGMVGPGTFTRITPTLPWGWNPW